VFKKVVGVDADFVQAGSAKDLESDLSKRAQERPVM
jgi:hypothetical protein